jgi:hypothetical protein
MRTLSVTAVLAVLAGSLFAADIPSRPKVEGPIQDNSFLVEEAYNQEDGVIQHISFLQLVNGGDFLYSQTDEWPVRTLKHQFSVTAALSRSAAFRESGVGFGDTAINYRYQLEGDVDSRIAIAPRLSLLLPSGSPAAGRGYGGTGLQTNIPVSISHGRRLVTHWNTGFTWIPSARDAMHNHARLINANLGQSTVVLISQSFNALCETVWSSNATVAGQNKALRTQNLFISPGVRWAYNFNSGLQIVPGVGTPIGIGPSAGQKGLILYLSFEHPYARAHSR